MTRRVGGAHGPARRRGGGATEDDAALSAAVTRFGAGETLRQRFSSPGTFIGECSVHPSGQIALEVVEA